MSPRGPAKPGNRCEAKPTQRPLFGSLRKEKSKRKEKSNNDYNTFLLTDKRVGTLVEGFKPENVKEIYINLDELTLEDEDLGEIEELEIVDETQRRFGCLMVLFVDFSKPILNILFRFLCF